MMMLRSVLVAALAMASREQRWIVRFDRYASPSTHYGAVRRVLGREGRRWRRRQSSPMIKPPMTDFVVVAVVGGGVVGALRSAVGFREARPDVMLRRSGVLWNATRQLATVLRRPTAAEDDSAGRRADRKKYGGVVAPGAACASLWAAGLDGRNASVAVFDTGIKSSLVSHFAGASIVERVNWTSEPTLEDRLGHGSFVSSLIVGRSAECPGFAPRAKLHVHKVFTNDQISYTSWFLDAFNYVLFQKRIQVVNLSVGGPDFADAPFVDKIREVTAAGVAVVSAIGNDGPTWGTLNSPADMAEVVGVAGTTWKGDDIAPFSSRGPPLSETRFKPDVAAPSSGVLGAVLGSRTCRAMHGTSVAAPSVAGAAALVASAASNTFNPAMLKQCLVETATPLRRPLAATGAGVLDAVAATKCAAEYRPRVSAYPADLSLHDCPRFAPHCEQPLIQGSEMVVGLTVLDGRGVGFFIDSVRFDGDALLSVSTDHDPDVAHWPWVGALLVRIQLASAVTSEGIARGRLSIVVTNAQDGSTASLAVPLSCRVAPAPPRRRRLLWDGGRSIAYPPAFAARDSLRQQTDLLDWNGDLPQTNFRSLFKHLRRRGFYVDVLHRAATCFEAKSYGALLVIDPEDEFLDSEINKLQADVLSEGLAVVVAADWHSQPLLDQAAFFDDNTQVYWTPAVAGSNLPALNRFLAGFRFGLGGRVYEGTLPGPFGDVLFDSGNALVKAPRGARLAHAALRPRHDEARSSPAGGGPRASLKEVPVLGLLEGRLAVFSDTACLDDAHHVGGFCFELLDHLLDHLLDGVAPNGSLFDTHLTASLQTAPPADDPPQPLFAKFSPRANGAFESCASHIHWRPSS